jgi:inorganic pyrophosphatase
MAESGPHMATLLELPAFRDEQTVNTVVESPRGSALKFKCDAATGLMMLSRPLPSGLVYPHDWGFVPSTRAADGDPLDACVLWDGVSYPGIVIPARPIGVLRVEQTNPSTHERERNDRLVVIPAKAARLDTVKDVSDIPERVRAELERFFTAAVAFEDKELTILGWGGQGEAMALVREARRERDSTVK